MATIHHNTLKRAAKHGIELKVMADGQIAAFVTRPDGTEVSVGMGAHARDVLDLAVLGMQDKVPEAKPKKARKAGTKKAGAKKSKRRPKFKCEACGATKSESDGEGGRVCSECGEPADDDGAENASVVKSKYKKKYKPFKQTCGDEMTKLIAAAVMVKTKVLIGGKQKAKMRIDRAKLKNLARLNDCWDPAYDALNAGMARMNVGNRLRKLARQGKEIRWP